MKILISISDRDLSKIISIYLNRLNIENDIANDGIQTLDKLLTGSFDTLLIESSIVRLNAKEVLSYLKKKDIKINTICINDKSTIDYSDLINNEFNLVIPKPFDIKKVIEVLKLDYTGTFNDLEIDSFGYASYNSNSIHFNIIELLILKKILADNKIEIDYLNSILKDDRFNIISNYIESLNYKLAKIKYSYNLKPIMKGYELVMV